MKKTHCPKHGLKLERMSFEEARTKSLFFRFMFLLTRPAMYDGYGEKRIALVCPKYDLLIEE
jgi:hypothetical protein